MVADSWGSPGQGQVVSTNCGDLDGVRGARQAVNPGTVPGLLADVDGDHRAVVNVKKLFFFVTDSAMK
jgi:hypothetical protein